MSVVIDWIRVCKTVSYSPELAESQLDWPPTPLSVPEFDPVNKMINGRHYINSSCEYLKLGN